jgi:hypothetical protein
LVQEVVIAGFVAGVVAGAVLRATSWAREHRRFVIASAATAVGFIAWNLMLVGTNATGINIDLPLTPLSFQDFGSGCSCSVRVPRYSDSGSSRTSRPGGWSALRAPMVRG